MRCYSNKICIADNSTYSIFDITTGDSISLFSYNQTFGKPLLNTIDENEFVFVTSTAQNILFLFFLYFIIKKKKNNYIKFDHNRILKFYS